LLIAVSNIPFFATFIYQIDPSTFTQGQTGSLGPGRTRGDESTRGRCRSCSNSYR
jgi:hypothetical protein